MTRIFILQTHLQTTRTTGTDIIWRLRPDSTMRHDAIGTSRQSVKICLQKNCLISISQSVKYPNSPGVEMSVRLPESSIEPLTTTKDAIYLRLTAVMTVLPNSLAVTGSVSSHLFHLDIESVKKNFSNLYAMLLTILSCELHMEHSEIRM